jgi:uncharacterized protein (TIGR03435 family)
MRGHLETVAADGSPVKYFWTATRTDAETQRVDFMQCSMKQLATTIEAQYLRHSAPVTDRTGIEGNYDFTLVDIPMSSVHRPATGPDDPPPDALVDLRQLSRALQKQIGLQLNPATVEGRSMVIDRLKALSSDE